MKTVFKPFLSVLTVLLLLAAVLTGCTVTTTPGSPSGGTTNAASAGKLDKNGTYTSKDDVALYLHTYGELPQNYITKKQAERLGWDGGSLEPYAPGKCLGGNYFGNYEGHLPKKKGRTYYECDIDTLGKRSRGPKRLVYSTDGLIYYTPDHYETFELLYGEE
ncbi:MAG: ribonuclease [Clostridia bacterium]|nr:ribonuclease [Clostridia bacterium]